VSTGDESDHPDVVGRLRGLRAQMEARGLAAYVLPTADPHLSEYVPPRWQTRAWFSGFTGSAGTLVVTRDTAGLWTDGRYEIQAEQQLAGSGIALFRVSAPGCPKVEEWLRDTLPAGSCVGGDGAQFSVTLAAALRAALEPRQIILRLDGAPVDTVWRNRPALETRELFLHDIRFCGRDTSAKLRDLRAQLAARQVDAYMLSALDDVAWLLNVRGRDLTHTPVGTAFFLLTRGQAVCFLALDCCPDTVRAELARHGVSCAPYGDVWRAVGALPAGATVLYDPQRTSARLRAALPAACRAVEDADPVQRLKAVKNGVELDNMRHAILRDCAAFARFQCWVSRAVAAGGTVTELSAAARLEALRRPDGRYLGPSFETIAAYGPHAAMMHYGATPETDARLEPHGLLLVDAGGQYLDGTTDLTRTIPLGVLPDQARREYTRVLQGHVGLARARWLRGATGTQLDILARGPLAQDGLDYRCGTGHGVGFCLCVHEGPQAIANRANPVALEPGMILTNEPGVYRAGVHGIRIENMMAVREWQSNACGRFLEFETLSRCPFDLRPVVPGLLTPVEREWLDAYQADTRRQLAPLVDDETRVWLDEICAWPAC